MPKRRKPSRRLIEEWVKQNDAGMTYAEIGKEHGYHETTVSKRVKVAREERSLTAARTNLITAVLQEHNQKLLAALGRHRDRLQFRPLHQITSAHSHPGEGAISVHEYGFVPDLKKFEMVMWRVEGENSLENEIVRDHLMPTRPTMWTNYDRWLRDHARYLWQAWRLGFEAFTEFRSRTGLSTERETTEPEASEWFLQGCIQKLVEAAVEIAGSRFSEIVESLRDDDNYVRVGDTRIVFAKSHRTREKVRAAFAEIAQDLARSEGAREIAGLIPGLKTRAESIRRQFEMVRVMGFIEGSCEACKAYVK